MHQQFLETHGISLKALTHECRSQGAAHWITLPAKGAEFLYAQWRNMNDRQRIQLMLETTIDLVMQGCSMEAAPIGSRQDR